MTKDRAIVLALELVREEMDNREWPLPVAEAAVGRIFRELSRLPASQDDSSTEELLEGFVRIAASATEVVALLAGKEGGA